MATPIYRLVDDLPEKSITTRMLSAIDFVAPGHYKNITGFENAVKIITGEDDDDYIQQVGDRAVRLFNDRSQGYQRAVWLYQTAETTSNLMAASAMANRVGEKFKIASFLTSLTPKPDRAQTIDFGVKLVVELVAFCLVNGLPGDSIGDFVKSLTNYRDESLMRVGALVSVDGLLPLGPDFLGKILDWIGKAGPSNLEENETFRRVRPLIPGGETVKQLGFIQSSMKSVSDWMSSYTKENSLSPDKVLGGLKDFIEVTDDRLDYVAAFVDLTTNYYEHTGIQTVARSLIERAVNEV